jgi:16S rRNA (adenine1518-N6/adenine1519-N6)-dimethyltransferase
MAITPSRAKELLERHGLRAGRRRGQHFLVDPNTVDKIVRLAGVRPAETILEIGPGLGSLTLALSGAAGHVVAVEVDTVVARALEEVVGGLINVEVVLADALEADLDIPARLVANLPYDVATPVFMRVLEDAPQISGGLVMVQREVGERWTASPGGKAYGAVSVKVAYHAEVKVEAAVSRTVFLPPPKVESVLVSFSRRSSPPVEVPDADGFLGFVTAAFAHRRKTLRNSLGAGGIESERVGEALRSTGLDERVRPEQLSIEELAGVYSALSTRS